MDIFTEERDSLGSSRGNLWTKMGIVLVWSRVIFVLFFIAI
jgi:hypothetical protein